MTLPSRNPPSYPLEELFLVEMDGWGLGERLGWPNETRMALTQFCYRLAHHISNKGYLWLTQHHARCCSQHTTKKTFSFVLFSQERLAIFFPHLKFNRHYNCRQTDGLLNNRKLKEKNYA